MCVFAYMRAQMCTNVHQYFCLLMQENLPAWARKPIKPLSSVLMGEPDDPLHLWACACAYVSVALARVRQGEGVLARSSFLCTLRGNLLAGQVFPPPSSYHSAVYLTSVLWRVHCLAVCTSLAKTVILHRIHLSETGHSMLSHSLLHLINCVLPLIFFPFSVSKQFLREHLIQSLQ